MMNPSKAYFSVKAGPYTLVSNFNPSVYAEERSLEFQGSCSLPWITHDEYALEMLYRVSIGSVAVENAFGTWLDDFGCISGSQYGSVLGIRYRDARMNYTTLTSKDYNYSAPQELYWTARTMGSDGDANMKDYVVMIPKESRRRKDLLIELHPNLKSKPEHADAILNGIEIMKLSDNNYSLAATFELRRIMEQRKKKVPHVIIVAGTLGIILGLFFTFFILIHRAWKKLKWGTSQILPPNSTGRSHQNIQQTLTSGRFLQFTLAEISIATSNFNEAFVIGEGGFGKVYKGILHHKRTPVAGPLSDHLYKKQKQPLPWIQRLKICVGAARGLHYLHTGRSHPVIHRDIKSANILLDQNCVA
ncbi:hypothetical protein VNO78_09389 [Psophocarpus tetragonolobus]|uniref:Protein kinase domain-containing protein n=1 Tax=Psophocarpus tetragonolobus TaxID=3891 RepID=A0AAN9SZ59_PSOTE